MTRNFIIIGTKGKSYHSENPMDAAKKSAEYLFKNKFRNFTNISFTLKEPRNNNKLHHYTAIRMKDNTFKVKKRFQSGGVPPRQVASLQHLAYQKVQSQLANTLNNPINKGVNQHKEPMSRSYLQILREDKNEKIRIGKILEQIIKPSNAFVEQYLKNMPNNEYIITNNIDDNIDDKNDIFNIIWHIMKEYLDKNNDITVKYNGNYQANISKYSKEFLILNLVKQKNTNNDLYKFAIKFSYNLDNFEDINVLLYQISNFFDKKQHQIIFNKSAQIRNTEDYENVIRTIETTFKKHNFVMTSKKTSQETGEDYYNYVKHTYNYIYYTYKKDNVTINIIITYVENFFIRVKIN